jgi:protein-ribulosamine 3-kinase
MIPSLPPEIQDRVSEILRTSLTSFSFSSGGCINNGGRLATSAGNYFIKWNNRKKFPGMFNAESKGLKLLAETRTLYIPQVLLQGEAGDHQFIVLEFVEEKPKRKDYWETLGEGLSEMHRKTCPTFGLDHDNYIGSLPQMNQPSSNWIEFFINNRLNAQLQLALIDNKIDRKTANDFQTVFKKLPSLLPGEVPALLHGDLWSGNLIVNEMGEPCLIDPAVYYGHREAEIAFTTLFGGFSEKFYESYHASYPLSSGFEQRRNLYNLYPLLVHVNLFGGGYVSQVVSILRAFV